MYITFIEKDIRKSLFNHEIPAFIWLYSIVRGYNI